MTQRPKISKEQKTEATKIVHQRSLAIMEILALDGVPDDEISLHALMMIGVEKLVERHGNEIVAVMLEEYAKSVRTGERIPK